MLLAACGSAAALAPEPTTGGLAPSRNAKAQRLLYVLDISTHLVDVFSYPHLSPKLVVGDVFNVEGMCTDGTHIWIPGAFANEIAEYDAGRTEPIATLSDPGYEPDGCAYDKTTGNLAVTNFFTDEGFEGNLLIYPKAKGTPKSYTCNLFYYDYVTYDDSGNLYLDGSLQSGSHAGFCVMEKGQKSLSAVDVNVSFELPGGMLWDGKYVAVSDESKKTIYRFDFRKGFVAKTKQTVMGGLGQCVLFWITNGTLICPNPASAEVEFYRYPQGGKPTRTFGGVKEPQSALVVTKGSYD